MRNRIFPSLWKAISAPIWCRGLPTPANLASPNGIGNSLAWMRQRSEATARGHAFLTEVEDRF